MCVDGLGYVYVCEGYVVLDQCDEPPPLLVCALCLCVWWCSGVFLMFSFLCQFCFLYCVNVRLGAVYEVFWFLDFVSDSVYVDLKYDDVLSIG